MRARLIFTLAAVVAFGSLATGQQTRRCNPMIELLSQKKPVFGLYAPSNRRMGGGGPGAAGAARPATPPADAPPAKTAAQLAQEALAFTNTDYIFDGSMEGGMSRAPALT